MRIAIDILRGIALLAIASAPAVVSPAAARSGASAPDIVIAQTHDHNAAPPAADVPDEPKPELAPDVEFGLWISQVRGHLLIGNDLVKEKQWNAAYPHFQHPIEELYKVIEPRLADYQAPPFDAALKALSEAVKAHKQPDYDAAWKTAMGLLAKADDGLKTKQKDWAAFTVTTAIETLKSSIDEYTSALDKGRIAKPVEYQDARGFIWQSERMIESVAAALGPKKADALKKVRAAYADLKKAFPTAMPPSKPVKNLDAMKKGVGRIETAAGPLM